MTTNRNYQSRGAAVGLDDWILDFLLYGDCEPRIRAYIWNPQLCGCLCNRPVYEPLWGSIRDRVLPAWKRAHRDGSLPWAEMKREARR